MMASLFSGVSGLKNHQVKMNVIGNNIANINTIGFKTSRVNFQEALVQTFKGAGRPSAITGGTNPIQLGLGMQVASIDNLFLQGGLETTGQITDMALQGSGFFVLGDDNDNRFYTRAGAFGFDANAALVDPATGLFVMGKMADTNGQIPSLAITGKITLPFGQQDPPKETSAISLSNNLNASATTPGATLVSSGTTLVDNVSGTAANGVGGTHTVTIAGAQAQQSSFTGTVGGLTNSTTLSSLGVTIYDDFTLTIDGVNTESIVGLSAVSTVGDLINAIDGINGVSAELIGGNVVITRIKAGAQGDYNFVSSASVNNGIDTNIVNAVFGTADGLALASAGGAASTYVVTDSFIPDYGTGSAAGPFITNLNLVFNETTGLAESFSGLGGGGITANTSNDQIAAGTLVVETPSSSHSMSIAVFDEQGEKHIMSLEFFKSAVSNRWEWEASMLGNETVTSGGSGYVIFNSDGSLNTFEHNGSAQELTIDPQNGAGQINIDLNAGSIGGFDGLTGFSGSHTASIVAQDGFGLGILEKIAIDDTGNISGIFSNGVTRVLAQIVLADFSNQAGLRKAGRSMYQASANSGEGIEGIAGSTISGKISSGALESSTVDIAQEFTNMITAQRGFQANARIITTSDQILDELVNIKR